MSVPKMSLCSWISNASTKRTHVAVYSKGCACLITQRWPESPCMLWCDGAAGWRQLTVTHSMTLSDVSDRRRQREFLPNMGNASNSLRATLQFSVTNHLQVFSQHVLKGITGAPFCKSHLSSHARRLLAAAIRSTTDVRKSLGSLRVALPS